MNIRNAWKVPVYCAVAGWVCFYLTVYLGRFFYVVQTLAEDGTIHVSADPVRSTIFSAVLFLVVLLLGGLWFFRTMSRAEIALSASIASGLYLLLVLAQLFLPQMTSNILLTVSIFQDFVSFPTSLLFKLTGHLPLSAILGSFTPLLFIPFGKSSAK